MTDLQLLVTEDGSHTLFHPALDETYHSQTGAIQESQHVYIDHGLKHRVALSKDQILSVLEIGFGTGLNAWLTLGEVLQSNMTIHYTTIEAYPIDEQLVDQLNYTAYRPYDKQQNWFQQLHRAPWDKPITLHPRFVLEKQKADLQSMVIDPNSYDVIYYDAFAPDKQPELWQRSILSKTTEAMRPGASWVTYSAKGQLKRDLKSLGLSVISLPGAPGKREMIRGEKG